MTKFQNALAAFKDCSTKMVGVIDGSVEPLSAEELKAACELAVESLEFLKMIHQTWAIDWRDADAVGVVNVIKAVNMNAMAARIKSENVG